jgi:succinate dehydrogenase (ubiquinone) membrane anchor subunit
MPPRPCAGKPALAEQPSAIIAPDSSGRIIHLYHKLNLALLGLTPVALVLSPSVLNMPVDLALGVLFPLHAHVAMNGVITDYAGKVFGKGATMSCRIVMLGFTCGTILGFARLNLTGEGLTESVKGLWRKSIK